MLKRASRAILRNELWTDSIKSITQFTNIDHAMPYSIQIGSIPCHIVSDGRQLSDGGGFFGLVPRVLWERVIPPDANNRIPVQMRSLLIQSSAGLILVDTGQGDKLTSKERRNFGMDDSSRRLAADLRRVGFSPEDVDIVLMTHLHGDHAGGCTHWKDPSDPGQRGRPLLPQRPLSGPAHRNGRRFLPQRAHPRHILSPKWQPLRRSGQLELVDGDQSLAVGVATLTVPGHTESIQAVWVEDGGESLLFLGDACSWAAHLDRIAWVPSFDLYPMRSIESKRALRLQAEEKNALLVFQHDGQVVTGRLRQAARGAVVQPEITEEAWPADS